MTPKEMQELTNKVITTLGDSSLEDGVTILVNTAGHLLAATCEGRPSAIRDGANSIAEGIKAAALSKILHDDAVRRAN